MRVAVVGAGGFIGRHVHSSLLAAGVDVTGVARSVPPAATGEWFELDLAAPGRGDPLRGFDVVVFTAGGADHSLGDRDPVANLEQNCVPLLRCLESYDRDLVLLSSQAVYSGLCGQVDESVDHLPAMPYGLAKAVAETHALLAGQRGALRRVVLFRLMYAFGPGEAPRRLLPRLAASASGGPAAGVVGGGRSLLNPLPVGFVGDVLAAAAAQSPSRPGGNVIMNLCHPEVWSVRDVVDLAVASIGATARVTEEEERWPVSFHGDSRRLEAWLTAVGLSMPPVGESLTDYLHSLLPHQDRVP